MWMTSWLWPWRSTSRRRVCFFLVPHSPTTIRWSWAPGRAVSWERAWAWAVGREALPPADQPGEAEVSPEQDYEFAEASRPYDPPPNLLMSEIEAMEAELGPLVKEWITAIRSGNSPERLALLLRAESLLNRLPTGGEISITHDSTRSPRG
jgi:hypothetical protein